MVDDAFARLSSDELHDGERDLYENVRQGTVIDGKYRVEAVIGIGGMAVVFRAHHIQLDEPVALKFLKAERRDREAVTKRFENEAKAAAKLRGDHVARVFDVGVYANLVFIVMELLAGEDLGRYLEEHGPLPLGQAADLMIQACDALAEAHARGIIHRDVKPENFFVVEQAGVLRLKLLDFGVSKVVLTEQNSDIDLGGGTQGVVGSPYYIAPEQLRMQTVDGRTDIWALGAVFFELLTGVTAFGPAKEFTVLVAHILERPHASLRAHRPDLPPGVEDLIGRCLAKYPDGRFSDVAMLADALAPCALERSQQLVAQIHGRLDSTPASESSSRAVSYDAAAVTQSQRLIVPAARPTVPSIRSSKNTPVDRRGPIAATIIALLIAFIAFSLFFWRTPRGSDARNSRLSSATATTVAAALAPAVDLRSAPLVPPPAESLAVHSSPAVSAKPMNTAAHVPPVARPVATPKSTGDGLDIRRER